MPLSPIVLRVLERSAAALVKPMDPAKLTALLLKIRKGSTSGLTMPQILSVLDSLGGWKVEPFVGLVQIREEHRTSESSREEVEKLWKEAQRNEVSSLPSNPKPDQVYTMNVSSVEAPKRENGYFSFTSDAWMGAKALKVRSPEGRTFDVIASRYDLVDIQGRPTNSKRTDPLKMYASAVLPWLYKETRFEEQVSEALNLPSVEEEKRQKERAKVLQTKSNVGTCPCCFGLFKLTPKADHGDKGMVGVGFHGYKRPGTGSLIGDCFGVGWPPFELSKEGTETYIPILKVGIRSREEKILALEAEIEKQRENGGFPESKLLNEVSGLNSAKGTLEWILRDCQKHVGSWKLEPLPGTG